MDIQNKLSMSLDEITAQSGGGRVTSTSQRRADRRTSPYNSERGGFGRGLLNGGYGGRGVGRWGSAGWGRKGGRDIVVQRPDYKYSLFQLDALAAVVLAGGVVLSVVIT